MRKKYAFFHITIHFLLGFIVGYFLKVNLVGWFVVIAGTWWVDVDHLSLIKKMGLRKYFYLRTVVEYGKPRKYSLHNIRTISISFLLSFLTLSKQSFLIGLFFLCTFLHLFWDLVEDILIFKMRGEHWL